jgi:hypothetical protein
MLELIRDKKNSRSIMGHLNHNNELLCYTLENALKAIPAGTYKLEMTYSPKFKKNMPEILNVPNKTGIRIHTGNIPTDSDGCILVGEQEEGIDDLIIKSKLTFDRILPILENEKEITIKESL